MGCEEVAARVAADQQKDAKSDTISLGWVGGEKNRQALEPKWPRGHAQVFDSHPTLPTRFVSTLLLMSLVSTETVNITRAH